MRKRHLFLPLVFFLICGFQSAKNSDNREFHLLFPVTYHKNEVNEKSGESWYGVYKIGKGYKLRSSVVRIKKAIDYDEDSSNMTAKEVVVDKSTKPLFLIKGPFEFKEGNMETVFSGYHAFYSKPSLLLKLGDTNQYHFDVKKDAVQDQPGVYKNFRVVLRNGKDRQVVVTMGYVNGEGGPILLWAGDIDRDGKLDFLMDIAGHYNASEPALYLSSQASPGTLVKKVASRKGVGC